MSIVAAINRALLEVEDEHIIKVRSELRRRSIDDLRGVYSYGIEELGLEGKPLKDFQSLLLDDSNSQKFMALCLVISVLDEKGDNLLAMLDDKICKERSPRMDVH